MLWESLSAIKYISWRNHHLGAGYQACLSCTAYCLSTWSRTSSVGKVGDSELGCHRLKSRHVLFLDYELGSLKDMIAALEWDYIIYMKLRRTKSMKL